MLTFFVLIGLVLSANMKCVVYLNFRQKWTSLLLLLLTLFYLLYIFFSTSSLAEVLSGMNADFTNYRVHVFILSLMTFVMVYSIFSFLVILFNQIGRAHV